jgi:hypothetical protein
MEASSAGKRECGAEEDESSTGRWISPYYCPFKFVSRVETYEPFISLIFDLEWGAAVKLDPRLQNQWVRGHACIFFCKTLWTLTGLCINIL